MPYSPTPPVKKALAAWNAAASKLPEPEPGQRVSIDNVNFEGYSFYDPRNNCIILGWQLMSPQWDPLGVEWPKEAVEKA